MMRVQTVTPEILAQAKIGENVPELEQVGSLARDSRLILV